MARPAINDIYLGECLSARHDLRTGLLTITYDDDDPEEIPAVITLTPDAQLKLIKYFENLCVTPR
jgi:hypothetical protein